MIFFSIQLTWIEHRRKIKTNQTGKKDRQRIPQWEAVKVTSSIRCHQMLMTRQQGWRQAGPVWGSGGPGGPGGSGSPVGSRSPGGLRGPGVPGCLFVFQDSTSHYEATSSSFFFTFILRLLTTRVTFHHLLISKQATSEIWPWDLLQELCLNSLIWFTSGSSVKVAAAAAAVAAVWALVSPDHSRHIRRAAAVDSLFSAAAAAKTNI